jgi:hypothetical protein
MDDKIEHAMNEASEPPWMAFIEDDQPIGGTSVIWIGESDDEPDMYVWLEDDIAPGADVDFIAHARQDIPSLVSTVRRLKSIRPG